MSLNHSSARSEAPTGECGYQKLYNVLFEQTHDFAFLLDADGTVVEANERVCTFTGAGVPEIVGTEFSETPWFQTATETRHRLREDLQRAIGGERIERHYRIKGKDRSASVDVSIRPVLDPRGSAELLFVTAVETTGWEQRIAELEAQNDCLEEYVRVVAHDVRNLLEVATGNLELAAEIADLPELETANNSLERIERLLDHFADTVRDGELIGEREQINLAVLANEAWEYTDTCQGSLAIEDSLQFRADKTRLMQVFENFYRNAVEHAGPDVTVRVGTTERGFYVEDDGPGLPADVNLFETGVSTTCDGMGFGLSIVETIVNAHGWSIRATEGTTGGARFEICFDAPSETGSGEPC